MTAYEILSIVAWFGAIILILLFPKLENKFLGFMTRNQPEECDKTVQTSELTPKN